MAASNIYLKLDGLDGESLDEDHKDWIEVQNWSWGVDNPASFAVGQDSACAIADPSIASTDVRHSLRRRRGSHTAKLVQGWRDIWF